MVRSATNIAKSAQELGIRLVAPRSAARLEELLTQAAETMETRPSVEHAEHVIGLLGLAEALGLRVSIERLQDAVLCLLRGEEVLNWPREVVERLALGAHVEVGEGVRREATE